MKTHTDKCYCGSPMNYTDAETAPQFCSQQCKDSYEAGEESKAARIAQLEAALNQIYSDVNLALVNKRISKSVFTEIAAVVTKVKG